MIFRKVEFLSSVIFFFENKTNYYYFSDSFLHLAHLMILVDSVVGKAVFFPLTMGLEKKYALIILVSNKG